MNLIRSSSTISFDLIEIGRKNRKHLFQHSDLNKYWRLGFPLASNLFIYLFFFFFSLMKTMIEHSYFQYNSIHSFDFFLSKYLSIEKVLD